MLNMEKDMFATITSLEHSPNRIFFKNEKEKNGLFEQITRQK